MAARAGPVDPFGARHLASVRARGARPQERAARGEVGQHARIVDVLAAAAVAGLAADADLDEVAGREARAQRVDPLLERARAALARPRQPPALRRRRVTSASTALDQRRARPRSRTGTGASRRQQLVDDLALVAGRPARAP